MNPITGIANACARAAVGEPSADELHARGDVEGSSVRKRILAAVTELLCTAPSRGRAGKLRDQRPILREHP
jgi:hypothetical protein